MLESFISASLVSFELYKPSWQYLPCNNNIPLVNALLAMHNSYLVACIWNYPFVADTYFPSHPSSSTATVVRNESGSGRWSGRRQVKFRVLGSRFLPLVWKYCACPLDFLASNKRTASLQTKVHVLCSEIPLIMKLNYMMYTQPLLILYVVWPLHVDTMFKFPKLIF